MTEFALPNSIYTHFHLIRACKKKKKTAKKKKNNNNGLWVEMSFFDSIYHDHQLQITITELQIRGILKIIQR